MKDRSAEPPPRHYQRLRLAIAPRAMLWLAAVVPCGVGLALTVNVDRSPATTPLAGVLLTAGAVAVLAARKLADHEIVLTRTSLRSGFGPFSHAYALWDLRPVGRQSASGWRRLYARFELIVDVATSAGTTALRLPTDDPDELSAALSPPERNAPP